VALQARGGRTAGDPILDPDVDDSAQPALVGRESAARRGRVKLAPAGRCRSACRADRICKLAGAAGRAALGAVLGAASASDFVGDRSRVLHQISGINAVLYYLGDIFAAAGFDAWSADLQSVAIGATNLAAALLDIHLLDRAGRRTLILVGSVGTAAALLGVALIMANDAARAWLLPLLIVFIASFAISQGAVIWVYLSEILPTRVRARSSHRQRDALDIQRADCRLLPRHRCAFQGRAVRFFARMMVLQFIAAFFLDAGNARRGAGTNERTAPYGRAKVSRRNM
jgi:Sugar (and other) transporter